MNFNTMRSGCRLFILRCFHIFTLKIVRHSKRSPVKLAFSPAKPAKSYSTLFLKASTNAEANMIQWQCMTCLSRLATVSI